ncbi:MAG: lipoprotein [Steroidobacteraceae bacterium]
MVPIALLSLAGCGQKGPLCLQEPKPATVPAVSAPTPSDASSASAGASSAPAPVSPLPAAAPAAGPVRPVVPGYTRCH